MKALLTFPWLHRTEKRLFVLDPRAGEEEYYNRALCTFDLEGLLPAVRGAARIRLSLYRDYEPSRTSVWLHQAAEDMGDIAWSEDPNGGWAELYPWTADYLLDCYEIAEVLSDDEPHRFWMTCETRPMVPGERA